MATPLIPDQTQLLASYTAMYQQSLQKYLWVIALVLILIAVAGMANGQSPSDYEPISPGLEGARRAGANFREATTSSSYMDREGNVTPGSRRKTKK